MDIKKWHIDDNYIGILKEGDDLIKYFEISDKITFICECKGVIYLDAYDKEYDFITHYCEKHKEEISVMKNNMTLVKKEITECEEHLSDLHREEVRIRHNYFVLMNSIKIDEEKRIRDKIALLQTKLNRLNRN